ncbi:MAG: site-specific integrase [Desulfuromonadaceae bacterium]
MEKEDFDNQTIKLITNIASVAEEELYLFFTLINAPPSLEGLLVVTAQFLKIAHIIKLIRNLETISEFITDEQFDVCITVAKQISNNSSDIENACPHTGRNFPKKIPFHGYYKKNPVYVCLGISSLEAQESAKHQILEAYITIAAAILQSRKKSRARGEDSTEYQHTIDESCRHARKLILKPKLDSFSNLPDVLPNKPGDYTSYVEHAGKLLEPIFQLLVYAFSNKRAPTYNKIGEKKEFRRVSHSINDAVDPELVGLADTVEIFQPIAERAQKVLDAPEPTRGIDFIQISDTKYDPMAGMPYKMFHQSKQYYLHSTAMNNQRLLYRWDMLTPHEVSCFLEAVQQLANNDYPSYRYIYPSQLELAAVMTTVFLRSYPLDKIEHISFSDAAYAQVAPPGYRYYKYKTGSWIVLPPKLPFDSTLDNRFYEKTVSKKREYFYVASGTGLEKIVDDYIETSRRNSTKNLQLFHLDHRRYQKRIDEVLSHLNKKHDTRITLKRIEIYIFNLLSRKCGGDLTTAMLLTGKKDSLGITPLHYTAYPVNKLQTMYHDCCSDLMNAHKLEMKARNSTILLTTDNPNISTWSGNTGTAYRPHRMAVKNIIDKLHERMQLIHEEKTRNLDKLIRIHNNIMRYTVIQFAFSTGFRAVNSPLLPPSQIDEDTGFAVISDKDGLDYYNSRIVWLPPICIQQYNTYLEHLDCLLPKLEFLDIKAFNALKHLLHFPKPSNRLPLFFYLKRSGNTKIIRPTDVWADIRKNLEFELPVNANRHYLRSYLLENGCPPEVIAAFMGHWERGEEPWGRYSALSPVDYATILAKYIVKLLEEDGWKKMSGLQEHW